MVGKRGRAPDKRGGRSAVPVVSRNPAQDEGGQRAEQEVPPASPVVDSTASVLCEGPVIAAAVEAAEAERAAANGGSAPTTDERVYR